MQDLFPSKNRHDICKNVSKNFTRVVYLWVLFGGVAEEARADGLLDASGGLAAGDHVQLVPVHDAQQLLSDVLKSGFGLSFQNCQCPGKSHSH